MIAIAITLRVLEVPVPDVKEKGAFHDELRESWPNYLGYLLAFVLASVGPVTSRIFMFLQALFHA